MNGKNVAETKGPDMHHAVLKSLFLRYCCVDAVGWCRFIEDSWYRTSLTTLACEGIVSVTIADMSSHDWAILQSNNVPMQ